LVELLQKMFADSSDRSKVVLNDICSDCKKEVVIQITPTSGGFGLLGGALFEMSNGGYYAKCPVCYNLNQDGNKVVA
jgi:hypothetical protein